MTGQATIYAVAQRAGVSPSTVSRAFHSPDLLRDETRDHVREVARELGYVPNRAAGGLRSGRTSTLGLVVPDVANAFFASLVKAAQARARSADYAVLLVDAEEDPRLEEQAIEAFAKQVDGAVVFAPRTTDANLRRAASVTPLVLVNRPVGSIPSVVIDMMAGMREAVAHLQALGHRRCLYLSGPRESWSNRQRRTAFREAARRLGLTASVLGPFQPHFEAGLHAADRVLATNATAVIAYNDLLALGVLSRLAARGVAVPDEISVIGFDDIPTAAMTSPPLTTVAMPTAAAGRAAVDLLLAIVSGDAGTAAADQDRLRADLRVRASTGPVPASISARGQASR